MSNPFGPRDWDTKPSDPVTPETTKEDPVVVIVEKTVEPPYIDWDKDIPAGDIVSINVQQTRRNAAFERWLIWLESEIRRRGHIMVYRLLQEPGNWYVQPLLVSEVCIVDIEPNWKFALTQFHWATWQGFDVVDVLIRRAEGEKWMRSQP